MDDVSVPTGEATRLITMARDSSGAGVTGATLSLAIRRNSDGFWWDGSVFQSAHATVTMTETDATNLAGVYHVDFTPQVAFAGVVYITTATAGVTNDPFVATILAGSFLDNIDASLSDLATDADMTTVLTRLGSGVLDNEFFRMHAMMRGIIQTQNTILSELKKK